VQTDEFSALLGFDEHHWWYVGRRRVLRAQLDRLSLPSPARVLDAGCGSGRTLDELVDYGAVSAFDIEPQGVASAQARGHQDVREGRLEEIPFPDETFDLITCLDVVEHTPDDVRSLTELLRVARPGAHLVLTVPAYQLLWSSHDVANHHHRRYNRKTLSRAARAAGWEPVAWTYFNSVLFAPGAAVRLGERLRRPQNRRGRANVELTPRALDSVLTLPMRFEAWCVGHGMPLPFGMSLMLTVRAPAEPKTPTPTRESAAVVTTGT
jgi:SAM-dependent methyltransferase